MKAVYQNFFTLALTLITILASAQSPVLNSYPASSKVIFLDFDGHTVTGTSWNSNGAIICDAATLSASQVTDIYHRVAEDYRPFAVNVTTDSARYWSAPANRRMRVVLTPSSSWYGAAGGVAYINSFSWGDNTPCFVFTALLNNNVKNIAEAASHEVGHTFGLRHQSAYDAVCNKVSEYNSGKGSGEIGWAPIMGVGYYQNMTLWNYGANPFGCNSFQDDLSIITSNDNGISYRVDDHEDAIANATSASFNNNAFSINGIIEKPHDADAIKFTIVTFGRFTLAALPYAIGSGNVGSNIDVEVGLLNDNGIVLRIYNDAAALSTSVDTTLIPGTYYLVVKGKGNIYAPDYASLGSYTLNATFTSEAPLAVHKLQLKGTSENKQHKLDWEIVADEKVVTQTLESSSNAVNFQPLSTFGASARNYALSSVSHLTYYRLKIVLDNGRQHYSNVIALRSTGSSSKPYLIGNVTTSSITISSPSAYTYTILDVTGRKIAKGNLAQGMNTIYPSIFTAGIYVIRYENSAEVHTEKFTRQ